MRIIGINTQHDSTIAVVEDGNLVRVIEMEKDSHPRHMSFSPRRFYELLHMIGNPPNVLACGGWWDFEAGYDGCTATSLQAESMRIQDHKISYFATPHERTHLLCAYALSPYPQGQPVYVLVWEGRVGAFYEIDEQLNVLPLGHVLGELGIRYAFLFDIASPSRPPGSNGSMESPGKVMALASYADRSLPRTADEAELIQLLLEGFGTRIVSKNDLRGSPFYNIGVENPRFSSLAYQFSEAAFDLFFQAARQKAPKGYPLLIAGGCGLNCYWNSKWAECGLFDGVFVPPCPNDSGTGIGAAADAQFYYTGNAKLNWNVYCGEDFFCDVNPSSEQFTVLPYGATTAAQLLEQGAILAWARGRYELGPRALGHRSILAEPFRSSMRDRLNEIKQRESYRPVAPVCITEEAGHWFRGILPSPYMLHFNYATTDRLRAVTHVDGSARLQTVSKESNFSLHELLKAFGALTGFPVLCNTSLNYKGCGFINRMSDLVRFVLERNLDGMILDTRVYLRRTSQFAFHSNSLEAND